MDASAKGEQAYSNFKRDRLETDPPHQKFIDPMTKNNLKSFTSLSCKKKTRVNNKFIILKDRYVSLQRNNSK